MPELRLQPVPQPWQCWILNPPCWARDGTCVPKSPRDATRHITPQQELANSAFHQISVLQGFSSSPWPVTSIFQQDLLQSRILSFCLFIYLFIVFLGPHPQHVEVPRLGVELELQPPASTTATAMQHPSCICDLHPSSRQHRILNH